MLKRIAAILTAVLVTAIPFAPATANASEISNTVSQDAGMAISEADNIAGIDSINYTTLRLDGTKYEDSITKGTAKYYRINLSEDMHLKIQYILYSNSAIDFVFYDSEFNKFCDGGTTDGGGSSANPIITTKEYYLPKGTFYIREAKNNYWSGDSTTYSIAIWGTATNTVDEEPNDVPEQANNLDIDNKIYGLFHENDQHDYYKITIPRSGTVYFTGSFRTYASVLLFNTDMTQRDELSQSYSGSKEEPETKTVNSNLNAGSYYIRVNRSAGWASGSPSIYTIEYSMTAPSDNGTGEPGTDEPNPDAPDPDETGSDETVPADPGSVQIGYATVSYNSVIEYTGKKSNKAADYGITVSYNGITYSGSNVKIRVKGKAEAGRTLKVYLKGIKGDKTLSKSFKGSAPLEIRVIQKKVRPSDIISLNRDKTTGKIKSIKMLLGGKRRNVKDKNFEEYYDGIVFKRNFSGTIKFSDLR